MSYGELSTFPYVTVAFTAAAVAAFHEGLKNAQFDFASASRALRQVREHHDRWAASPSTKKTPDWLATTPDVAPYRRELAASIREQIDNGGVVYLDPTDAEIAADALDGFNNLDDE